MFEPERYYTIREVKEMTGINAQTLYKRLYADRIPVKLIAGVYKFTGKNAESLLVAKKRGRKIVKANLIE